MGSSVLTTSGFSWKKANSNDFHLSASSSWNIVIWMDSELTITQESSASSVSTIITPPEIELHYTITFQ